MGTNFYLETDFCPCCGKPKSKIHLGKASMGWKFLFRKSDLIQNYNDFCKVIERGVIVDEYERQVSELEMLELIQWKQKEKAHDKAYDVKGYDFCEIDFC